MSEVIGKISSLKRKQAANGDSYMVVEIDGAEGRLYDWQGHTAKAGVRVGDTVRVEHSAGRYPRIQCVEKVAAPEAKDGRAEAKPDREPNMKDKLIVRMSCLKTAVELLGQSGLDYETKELQVSDLAKRMEEWVLR